MPSKPIEGGIVVEVAHLGDGADDRLIDVLFLDGFLPFLLLSRTACDQRANGVDTQVDERGDIAGGDAFHRIGAGREEVAQVSARGVALVVELADVVGQLVAGIDECLVFGDGGLCLLGVNACAGQQEDG